MPGWIVTESIDSRRNGRPVSFAFVGPAENRDGSSVMLTVPLLRRSMNWKVMAFGQAYPMYYAETLPMDLRDELTAQMSNAVAARVGLWEVDRG